VQRAFEACQLGLLVAAGVGVLAAGAASAQGGPGDLLVAPTRVVLEGRQRTAEVTLVNTGSATATYRISFVNLRMNEQGGTTEIEASSARPGEQFAEPLVRYSPRQVTLEPQVAQTVRMQLRLPSDLPPGEYRSHLLFRAIPPVEPARSPTEGERGVQRPAHRDLRHLDPDRAPRRDFANSRESRWCSIPREERGLKNSFGFGGTTCRGRSPSSAGCASKERAASLVTTESTIDESALKIPS
jgi:hypothetical protein